MVVICGVTSYFNDIESVTCHARMAEDNYIMAVLLINTPDPKIPVTCCDMTSSVAGVQPKIIIDNCSADAVSGGREDSCIRM